MATMWVIEVGSDYRTVLSVPLSVDLSENSIACSRYEYALASGRNPSYVVLVKRENGNAVLTAYGSKGRMTPGASMYLGSKTIEDSNVFDGKAPNVERVLSYF